MTDTIRACHHQEWERQGLQDYGDFAECVSECNQQEWADCNSGEWFYIPDDPMPPCEEFPYERRVIYYGSWGNDNSPGASHYTSAAVYDMTDSNDVEEYERDKSAWEEQPEWAPQDMPCLDCGTEFEKSEMQWDEGQDGYVCAECMKRRSDNEEEEDEDDGEDHEGGVG